MKVTRVPSDLFCLESNDEALSFHLFYNSFVSHTQVNANLL